MRIPCTHLASSLALALALTGPAAQAATSIYLSVVNKTQKPWIVGRVGDTGGGKATVEKAFTDSIGKMIPSGGPTPLNFPVLIPVTAIPSSCVIKLEGKDKDSATIRVMDCNCQSQDFKLALKGSKGSLDPTGKLQGDALIAVDIAKSATGMAVVNILKDEF